MSSPESGNPPLLSVPFFRQSPGSQYCVPAALRMIFAYWGVPLTEAEVCTACNTDRSGTTVEGCLLGATRYGFQVEFWCLALSDLPLRALLPVDRVPSLRLLLDNARTFVNSAQAWKALRESLSNGRPVIAWLDIGRPTFHAVVVIGVTNETAFVLNPAEPEEKQPFAMPKGDFLRQWTGAEFTAFLIPASSTR